MHQIECYLDRSIAQRYTELFHDISFCYRQQWRRGEVHANSYIIFRYPVSVGNTFPIDWESEETIIQMHLLCQVVELGITTEKQHLRSSLTLTPNIERMDSTGRCMSIPILLEFEGLIRYGREKGALYLLKEC